MASADDGRTLAVIQGELWSARARDWAKFQEPQHHPKYEDAIRRTHIGPGRRVLDLGCGAGVFCRLAADAGASVTGIDAAPALIEIARERVPEGRFDVGDIQALPYQDRSFDIVTAFNILQFVPGPLTTLTEIRRVTKPEGRIYILVWGREQHTEGRIPLPHSHRPDRRRQCTDLNPKHRRWSPTPARTTRQGCTRRQGRPDHSAPARHGASHDSATITRSSVGPTIAVGQPTR